MATFRRTGCIYALSRPRGTYYTGIILVGGRRHTKGSYDRMEVEAWLADMLAENPTYEVDTGRRGARARLCPKPERAEARRTAAEERRVPRTNPFAGARSAAAGTPSLWAVTAECDPCTANYHLLTSRDWGKPERVLVVDEVNCVPIVWVADDNRGAGYPTEAEARERARELSDGGAVAYRVRAYGGVWETREGWRVRR